MDRSEPIKDTHGNPLVVGSLVEGIFYNVNLTPVSTTVVPHPLISKFGRIIAITPHRDSRILRHNSFIFTIRSIPEDYLTIAIDGPYLITDPKVLAQVLKAKLSY